MTKRRSKAFFMHPCKKCKGAGWIPQHDPRFPDDGELSSKCCPKCGGKGNTTRR